MWRQPAGMKMGQPKSMICNPRFPLVAFPGAVSQTWAMNEAERIGPALGKIPSGLFIATATLNGAPMGMLCSFVEQAGFRPPMISMAVGHGRPIIEALDESGLFGLHILGKENAALLKAFARGDNPAAFTENALIENTHGVPQFADAWAFLVAKVAGRLSAGDHTLYLAEVLDGALQKEGQEPQVRVRSNGFGY
jgi:3-hydroxy-9,10-secoandrosta-1,3,5(10)-triene-9,17-dione monooxygenase reductase component